MSDYFANSGARLSHTTAASDVDAPLETFRGAPVNVSTYLRPVTQNEIRKIIFEMKSCLPS